MKWRTLIKEEDPCMDRGVGLWEERERERERKKENGLGEMKEGVYKGFVASISGLIKKKRELRATQAVVWWP
jgi:hypothetical protein